MHRHNEQGGDLFAIFMSHPAALSFLCPAAVCSPVTLPLKIKRAVSVFGVLALNKR